MLLTAVASGTVTTGQLTRRSDRRLFVSSSWPGVSEPGSSEAKGFRLIAEQAELVKALKPAEGLSAVQFVCFAFALSVP